jgi:hypothetical protein
VHGVPAVVELIERLPPEDRPDVMALYPGWWKGLADRFGTPVDRVTIADDVEHDDGNAETAEVRIDARDDATWHEIAAPLSRVAPGDRIALTPHGGAWRGYHAWITRPAAVARRTAP